MSQTTCDGNEEPQTMAEELPKLSAAEFREYSRFAGQMDVFVWVPWGAAIATALTIYSITISVKPGTSCTTLPVTANGP